MVTAKKKTKKVKKPKTGEKYRSFRLARREDKPVVAKLPSIWWLLKDSLRFIKHYWKLFLGLGFVYLLLYKVMVLGFARVDVAGVREALRSIDESTVGQLGTLYSTAVGTDLIAQDAQANAYANLLTILFILILFWAMRKVSLRREIRIRDALYNGTNGFFSFMTVLLIVGCQAIPMLLGIFMYGTAKTNGIVNGGVEDLTLFVAAVGLTTISLYWFMNSLFSLIAVTLPGMYPLAAVRATKDLVAYRRFAIFLRILGGVVAVLAVWVVALLLIAWSGIAAFIAPEIADVLRSLTLVFSVVYMYKLYRSLFPENE